jgi:hypothetical protein
MTICYIVMYIYLKMPQKPSMFDINKFCNGERSTCNNIGYSKTTTAGNDPSQSNKMRYSQMLRSRRFKNVRNTSMNPPPTKQEIPLYHFPTGYIFSMSSI